MAAGFFVVRQRPGERTEKAGADGGKTAPRGGRNAIP